jgi:hypothetical protein
MRPTFAASRSGWSGAAEAVEGDQQRLAVASLSGQQLRAAEVRAKLGGIAGYATPLSEKGNAQPFVLNIHFSDRTQRIEGTPMHLDDPATPCQRCLVNR